MIAYLQLPILAVTIFGVVLAFIIVFEVGTPTGALKKEEDVEDWEGLFDE